MKTKFANLKDCLWIDVSSCCLTLIFLGPFCVFFCVIYNRISILKIQSSGFEAKEISRDDGESSIYRNDATTTTQRSSTTYGGGSYRASGRWWFLQKWYPLQMLLCFCVWWTRCCLSISRPDDKLPNRQFGHFSHNSRFASSSCSFIFATGSIYLCSALVRSATGRWSYHRLCPPGSTSSRNVRPAAGQIKIARPFEIGISGPG